MSTFLHRHPRILLLVMLTIVLAGLSSLAIMPRLEDPTLRKRVAVIRTVYPGGDPQTIETSITIPIEQSLEKISDIKRIRSNTRKDISNVVVELKDEVTNTDAVWDVVENRLQSLDSKLPQGCHSPSLEVFPLKAFASIIAIVPATDGQANILMLRRLAQQLRDRILRIAGTEQVKMFGDPGEEIAVIVKPELLAGTGLSTGRIANQIRAQNSYSGGRVSTAQGNLSIDLQADSRLIERLADCHIEYRPDQQPVALSEIADIERQIVQPVSSVALIDNQRGIVIGAMVDDAVRVDRWTSQLRSEIADFRAEFSGDYVIEPLFEQSDYINSRMAALLKNLAITTAAVMLVVLLMMGWRCMIIVAASLPLSVFAVIFGMRVFDIPIHQMSVTGLVVALGLLIDNAIVMAEEVRARIYAGRAHADAIVDSVHHLRLPLFGSTLTTVLAFLPIALLPGPSGEFVGSIAISVILAITTSFLISITLIPPLVGLVGVDSTRRGLFDFGVSSVWVESAYRWSLRAVFRFPVLGIVVGVLLPLFGFYCSQSLSRQFFPASDRNQIQIEIELSAASSLDQTRTCVEAVQRILAQENRVQRQSWFVGQSAPTFYYNVIPSRKNVPSYAQAFVDVAARTNVSDLVDDLQLLIDESVHNARVVVRELQQGPPFDAPLEVRVVGEDLDRLQRLGQDIRQAIAALPDVTHTRSDLADSVPQLDFRIDESVARDAQTNRKDVGRFMYAATEGASVGTVLQDGQELAIKVQIDFSGRSPTQLLTALPVPILASSGGPTRTSNSSVASQSQRSEYYTVGSLGEFELDADVAAIVRIDGRRVNEIKGYLRPGVLPEDALNELKSKMDEAQFQLPEGYDVEFGGESEQRSAAVSALMATAVTLFSVMVLSLVVVLGSFRNTMIIGAVGALSIGLGPLALWITGFPLGFMAIIGTMGLIGIAINDSIVVLAAIRANEGLAVDEQTGLDEVVSGCTRHILATTFTTMVGFVPLIVYGGKFWPPLAVIIACGVAGATLLALYFVPSVYRLVHWHWNNGEPA